MKVVDIAGSALARRDGSLPRSRRRPSVRMSLFDTPVSLARRADPVTRPRGRSKLMSLELDVGGLAIEFKAKNLAGLLTWLSIDVALAAVVQELMRPRQFRTWHGRVAGLIPYDFRKPTPRRLLAALWAPDNPHLFTDTAFGVGWGINLAQVPKALLGYSGAQRAYEPPGINAGREVPSP